MNHTIVQQITAAGTTVSSQTLVSSGAELNVDETITATTNDVEIDFALDVSQVRSIFLLSAEDLTLETNSGASPIDTLNLIAGKPYFWEQGGYHSLVFGTDVTSLFVTNGTINDAKLQIFTLYDPTV